MPHPATEPLVAHVERALEHDVLAEARICFETRPKTKLQCWPHLSGGSAAFHHPPSRTRSC
eukprot:6485737-Amphidinium_carterae.1